MLRLALARQGAIVAYGRRSLSSGALTRTLSAVETTFDEVHDVIVVGSGSAGCASALSAKLTGGATSKVVVLEKDKKVLVSVFVCPVY
jgi:hypothetical protein